MMNPKTIGSLNLDTLSSRYEFLKHVFKSMKTNKKIKDTLRMTDGARSRWGSLVSKTETEDGG